MRWEPASGAIDHFFDDEPVPGTQGVQRDLLKGVEPFPTKELVPYDAAYLSGYVVEHYQVVLVDAARASRESMHAQLEAMCAREVPGRHPPQPPHLSRRIRARPSSTSSCRSGCSPTCTGRGPTRWSPTATPGRLAGGYPKSGWKIAGAVLLAIIVALIVLFLTEGS